MQRKMQFPKNGAMESTELRWKQNCKINEASGRIECEPAKPEVFDGRKKKKKQKDRKKIKKERK